MTTQSETLSLTLVNLGMRIVDFYLHLTVVMLEMKKRPTNFQQQRMSQFSCEENVSKC